jgi:hypothetical protein
MTVRWPVGMLEAVTMFASTLPPLQDPPPRCPVLGGP